jgi:hypothetical protein
MARGATVFKNTGCDGKTDICFKYGSKIYEIDVKLASWAKDIRNNYCWMSSAASEVELPVYPVIVIPATGTDLSGWSCRWKTKNGSNRYVQKYHCPPGLEDFWN